LRQHKVRDAHFLQKQEGEEATYNTPRRALLTPLAACWHSHTRPTLFGRFLFLPDDRFEKAQRMSTITQICKKGKKRDTPR
jgi:hypothetical protein